MWVLEGRGKMSFFGRGLCPDYKIILEKFCIMGVSTDN